MRKDRERGAATEVLAAPALELPIDRGLAGPSMLADTIVRRWQDHQPLTRLEGIYRREQLDLAKSTLCTWHEQLADLARPLVKAMFEDAYRDPYLCVDATGVLVLAKEKCRNGHFWVLVAPEKHVLYGYSRRHDGLAVDNLLSGYKGYLVADAHSVYE
ncbi:MAG TPA: transposase, partial [Polyangiaceae bacterium]|nr:transposase [Polyangiaceae bacterium]